MEIPSFGTGVDGRALLFLVAFVLSLPVILLSHWVIRNARGHFATYRRMTTAVAHLFLNLLFLAIAPPILFFLLMLVFLSSDAFLLEGALALTQVTYTATIAPFVIAFGFFSYGLSALRKEKSSISSKRIGKINLGLFRFLSSGSIVMAAVYFASSLFQMTVDKLYKDEIVPPVTYQTYRSSVLGLEMLYPTGWQALEDNGGKAVIFREWPAPKHITGDYIFSINLLERDSSSSDSEAWLKERSRSYFETLPGRTIEKAVVNGISAVTARSEGGSQSPASIETTILHEGNVLEFGCAIYPKLVESDGVCDIMLSSVVWH